MIRVEFDPENHPERMTPEQQAWWSAWKVRAENATNDVIRAWEALRKDPKDETYKKIFEKKQFTSVWGDLKDWLLANVFYNKCAYCETPVSRSIFHAEHYRPKGRVISADGKVKIVDAKGQLMDHPGYFWLAFNWKNLLPSCAQCNTANGKKNQFPIPQTNSYASMAKGLTTAELNKVKKRIIQSETWNDIYYLQPDDLDELEGRLLLHPYFDDPQKCLRFDDFGKVISIGDDEEKQRGEWSIKVYNLNGGSIVTDRRQAQIEADKRFTNAYFFYLDQGYSRDDARTKAKEAVAEFIMGKKPYSAAVLDYLRQEYPKYFSKSSM